MRLSAVVLGSMNLSQIDQATVNRIVSAAIDRGISSIDTAPLYDAGACEEMLGKALAGIRHKVQILTKCGLRWDDDFGTRLFPFSVDGKERWVRKDSRATSIRKDIEESLRRLRTDTIDLMQIHQYDELTPLTESLEALAKARKEGKIRDIGVSNFSPDAVLEAQQILGGTLYSVQDEFSLACQTRSQPLLPLCQDQQLQFLAYSPLAHGVLSGKYIDKKLSQARQDWGAWYTHEANLAKINTVLSSIAIPMTKKYGISLSQLCLSWALAQDGVYCVVAGASSEQQAKDNALAASISIADSDIQALNQAMNSCQFNYNPGVSILDRLKQKARNARNRASRFVRRAIPPGR